MSGAFWWAGRRTVNTPPPAVAQLVTTGLYGSWRLSEGAGTAAQSEAGLIRPLTLTSDSGAIPTWRAGGGVVFAGGTGQLRRDSEAALDAQGGVTLTLALTPGTFTGVHPLFQRSAGNTGYTLQANTSAARLQVSMGTGSARSTASITPYAAGTPVVLSVSLPQGSPSAANVNGQEPSFTPNTFAWVGAAASALLIGYTFTGTVHYAALHTRALNAQERANMVAYAQAVLAARV